MLTVDTLRTLGRIRRPSVVGVLATARTFTLDGISSGAVRAEVDVHRGLPSFSIVGLPDAAVREARERVRAAITNCGFEFPLRRITVNLAPANVRKAGPGLDLSIAVAVLAASGQLEGSDLSATCWVGELALDGSTRAVPGVLAMAEAARRDGAVSIVVPVANGSEAALVDGIRVIAIDSLTKVVEVAAGRWEGADPEPFCPLNGRNGHGPDLADLRGQSRLRLALEIAAAGRHNLLMIGSPGVGKSLAARRLPSILPAMSEGETLDVARVASACGLLDERRLDQRPFRAPHHTISAAGLVGGGNPPRPGEVTLAHRGVLFLDEICEFSRDALEALREPLEVGSVSIVRAGVRTTLPSRFMLLAAANPCPCGRGPQDPECSCPPDHVRRYEGKLTGALADRIDMVVELSPPDADEISGQPGEPSAAVRDRVAAASERQQNRLGVGQCNAGMDPETTREQPISAEARSMLIEAYSRERLSGRAHDRVLRLARTIADLAGHESADLGDMAQALGLRRRGSG